MGREESTRGRGWKALEKNRPSTVSVENKNPWRAEFVRAKRDAILSLAKMLGAI